MCIISGGPVSNLKRTPRNSASLYPKCIPSHRVLYQGLHMDRGYVMVLRASLFSMFSVVLWLCSLSVSSKSEHRSSLDVVEGAGERAEDELQDRLLPPGEARVVHSISPPPCQVLLLFPEVSVIRSISTSWSWSSLRGIHSRRWLRSSAAIVASIPGQLDTNMWTSCMH